MTRTFSRIVETVADFFLIFIIVFGIYVITHGHLTPGGGFQGGVVLAAGILLLLVAHGFSFARKIPEELLSDLEAIGGIAFILLASLGFGQSFFYNILWHEKLAFAEQVGRFFSGGAIPLMNLSVGLKVVAGITSGMFALSLFGGEES